MQEKNIQYHTLYFDVPFEILLLYIILTRVGADYKGMITIMITITPRLPRMITITITVRES